MLLGRLSYEGGSARAARGPFQLRDMLNIARDQGYAVDRDETFLGLSCVATPVFDKRRSWSAPPVLWADRAFPARACQKPRRYSAV